MQANMLRRYEKAFWCFCFGFFLLGVRQYNIQSIQNRVLLIGLKKKKSLNTVSVAFILLLKLIFITLHLEKYFTLTRGPGSIFTTCF